MNIYLSAVSNKVKKNVSTFDDMIHWYKKYYRYINILPFEGRDINFIGSKLLLAYLIFMSCIYVSMFLVFMILNPTIEAVCETIVVAGTTLRYYMMLSKRKQLAKLLDESRTIWAEFNEDDHREVRLFEQKIRRLYKFLLVTFFSTNFSYCVSAATATITATPVNGTHPLYLPFKWYTTTSLYTGPAVFYPIIFVTQVMVTNNSCVYGPSVDSAAPLLIMIGAGYFRALQNRLKRIADNEDEASADLELMNCTQLHQKILNFCSGIDKITRNLFFVTLLCTVYNISLSGIQLVGTAPDRYKFVPLTVISLGQLFVCQWAPDNVIDESTEVATAAYSSSVVWMKRRTGKLLVLIIARAQRPVQMTGAGVVNLSLEKFGSMLTSAFSFFTVLRSFNEE